MRINACHHCPRGSFEYSTGRDRSSPELAGQVLPRLQSVCAETCCSKCRHFVPTIVAVPNAPVSSPTRTPQAAWRPPIAPPPDSRQADLAALSNVWTAALISVFGSALGVAVPLALSSTGYFHVSILTTGSAVTNTLTALYVGLGLAIIGFVISIAAFWFYGDGFLALRDRDARFSRSYTWTTLAIVGLILVCLSFVAFFVGFAEALTCDVGDTAIPARCLNLVATLGGASLLLVGGIVFLIGYVGMLVAIWRLGDRYGSSLFKVGAVLLIIPFLSVVGHILVMVGASQTRSRVWQIPGYGMAPSADYPPPPPSD